MGSNHLRAYYDHDSRWNGRIFLYIATIQDDIPTLENTWHNTFVLL